LHELSKHHIQGGIALEAYYPELKNCLLLCATETKTQEDIHLLARTLQDILNGAAFTGGKMACQA
jgi:glycine dehydrogenase subunit 1